MKTEQAKHNYEIARQSLANANTAYLEAQQAVKDAHRRQVDARDSLFSAGQAFEAANRDLTLATD